MNEVDEQGEALIVCHLSEVLESRKMTLSRLSELAGVSIVNLSILKNGHAKAVRFSTLQAVCLALDCQIGDILSIKRG